MLLVLMQIKGKINLDTSTEATKQGSLEMSGYLQCVLIYNLRFYSNFFFFLGNNRRKGSAAYKRAFISHLRRRDPLSCFVQ